MSNFHKMVVYQIYPKSFLDTDGNGVGDLAGIKEKIPYLKDLGIEMIWMNPIFSSPQKDNGYDISNYYEIDPMFGTMEELEDLIAALEDAGIGLMFDMVFNHTSIEHEWFQRALAGDKAYQDMYIIRDPKPDGSLPTNWESKFGGPSWQPFGDTGKYYLNLYDPTQADLNWRNSRVVEELSAVVRHWMDKGIRGFRFDVLNVIGKDEVLVDSEGDNEKSLYTDTPIVHEYIHKLSEKSFGQDPNIVTVGEMSSTSLENSILYSNPARKELSMVFSFHHLKVDYKDGEKWSKMPFDFEKLKHLLHTWQVGMAQGGGWNAVFWNNHDQPRAINRFGDPVHYRYRSATMLATVIHMMRGTPYVYMGEEIGMSNPNYEDIEQYVDVESKNAYEMLLEKGHTAAEALQIVQDKSRDNGRSPMQWDDSGHAGFTEGTPWLQEAGNYESINVARELERVQAGEESILTYYRRLIALRKEMDVISDGDYLPLLEDNNATFAYRRDWEGESLAVFCNFYPRKCEIDLTREETFGAADSTYAGWEKLIGNADLDCLQSKFTLEPYEAVVFYKPHA